VQTRLVTITGPGGCGKTRFALEVAENLMPDWKGAVWFVPLADIQDAGLVMGAIRDVLGLPRPAAGKALEQVVSFLSRQPSLLILDNLEQLVAKDEAGSTSDSSVEASSTAIRSQVRTLLARVPTLVILATSRHWLDIGGEREFSLAPLPVPAGVYGPEPCCAMPACRYSWTGRRRRNRTLP
jgi:predicted ATPase